MLPTIPERPSDENREIVDTVVDRFRQFYGLVRLRNGANDAALRVLGPLAGDEHWRESAVSRAFARLKPKPLPKVRRVKGGKKWQQLP